MTIFASFNVPPLLGPVLSQHLSKGFEKYASGQSIAQFAAPAAIQLVSTPLHLLGLDLYNRPFSQSTGLPSVKDRWQQVSKNWVISATARIGRIVPAFGFGGVINLKVRRSLMDRLV